MAIVQTTLRNGARVVFEVRVSFDAEPLTRALLGLEFSLACMPHRPRALRAAQSGLPSEQR